LVIAQGGADAVPERAPGGVEAGAEVGDAAGFVGQVAQGGDGRTGRLGTHEGGGGRVALGRARGDVACGQEHGIVGGGDRRRRGGDGGGRGSGRRRGRRRHPAAGWGAGRAQRQDEEQRTTVHHRPAWHGSRTGSGRPCRRPTVAAP